MSSQGFAKHRQAITLHRKSVEDEATIWHDTAFRIKPGKIDPTAFTNDGIRIGTTYNQIVEDYAWYVWRIGKILEEVADALETTVRNYGQTEEIIVDDITSIGEQF